MKFTLNRAVEFEESLTCEFKEVKTQALQSIGKIVDEYIVAFLNEVGGSIYWGIRDSDRLVTGVPLTAAARDEVRQVIGQKVAVIAPPVLATLVEAPFHAVLDSAGEPLRDLFVLEVRVTKPVLGPNLFLTGAGEAYRRTMGGTKKLSGAELFSALGTELKNNRPQLDMPALAGLPSVERRLSVVAPFIRGRRVLWVDDRPSLTFYERLALTQMGLAVDVASTTRQGLTAALQLKPDVILSDMERDGQQDAGIEFLNALRVNGVTVPVVFYISRLDLQKGTPGGAFGITSNPAEMLHLVLDVIERGTRD